METPKIHKLLGHYKAWVTNKISTNLAAYGLGWWTTDVLFALMSVSLEGGALTLRFCLTCRLCSCSLELDVLCVVELRLEVDDDLEEWPVIFPDEEERDGCKEELFLTLEEELWEVELRFDTEAELTSPADAAAVVRLEFDPARLKFPLDLHFRGPVTSKI